MEKVIEILASVAEELDQAGLAVLADRLDTVANAAVNIKVAQYVGIQGYSIRNTRCWEKCYRQKRTSSPNKAAQQVWTECHKEYIKALNDNDSEWNKYAETEDSFIKTASADVIEFYKTFDKKVASSIEDKLKIGTDLGSAIFASIDDLSSEPQEEIISASNEILDIAASLVSRPDLAEKLCQASENIIKESGFFDGIGKAVGDRWQGAKFDYQIGNQVGEVDRHVKSIMNSLVSIEAAKSKLSSFLQGFKPRNPQQQQSLQNAMQGVQSMKIANPQAIQRTWDTVKQNISFGTGQAMPSSTAPSAAAAAAAPAPAPAPATGTPAAPASPAAMPPTAATPTAPAAPTGGSTPTSAKPAPAAPAANPYGTTMTSDPYSGQNYGGMTSPPAAPSQSFWSNQVAPPKPRRRK